MSYIIFQKWIPRALIHARHAAKIVLYQRVKRTDLAYGRVGGKWTNLTWRTMGRFDHSPPGVIWTNMSIPRALLQAKNGLMMRVYACLREHGREHFPKSYVSGPDSRASRGQHCPL